MWQKLAYNPYIRNYEKGTEKDLPEQTLGHIQHTCEALSAAHIHTHHQFWRLIHGDLAWLVDPEWKFLCISGEKCLQTLWNDVPFEIEGLQYLNRLLYGTPSISNVCGHGFQVIWVKLHWDY